MMCPYPLNVLNPKTKQRMNVPCGKCGFCMENKKSQWKIRLEIELREAVTAHFITLTYTEENLPVCEETGEMEVLKKKHVQDWLKRLRNEKKNSGELEDHPIKYYVVGEYGTKTHRPHYHGILFNVPQKVIAKDNCKWSVDGKKIGYVKVGTVTPQSINYTCNYMIAHHKNINKGIQPFSLMSKGLGKSYIENNRDKHSDGNGTVKNYITAEGGIKKPMPRYFKDKIFSEADKITITHENARNEIDRIRENEKHLKKKAVKYPSQYLDKMIEQMNKRKLEYATKNRKL